MGKVITRNDLIKLRIGQEYIKGVQGGFMNERYEFVVECFEEINKINRELFSLIPYKVVFTSDDVYASAAEMRKRVQEEGVIYIYDGWSGHPILTLEDNLIGRAVHDVFAHCVCGCPFTFEGEYSAYLEQRKWYPEWTWKVLFAEIPAQTAAYYYKGNHDFPQRAIAATNNWMKWGNLLTIEDYSHNSILNMESLVTREVV
jgi:hypothetical protein